MKPNHEQKHNLNKNMHTFYLSTYSLKTAASILFIHLHVHELCNFLKWAGHLISPQTLHNFCNKLHHEDAGPLEPSEQQK